MRPRGPARPVKAGLPEQFRRACPYRSVECRNVIDGFRTLSYGIALRGIS